MSLSFLIVLAFIFTTSCSESSAVYIDCNGKGFYCTSPHTFLICVDMGNGLTQTVDDVLKPCPEGTLCSNNARFECAYIASPNYEHNTGTINLNNNQTKMTNQEILSDEQNETMPTLETTNKNVNNPTNIIIHNQQPTNTTPITAFHNALPADYNIENHSVNTFYQNQNFIAPRNDLTLISTRNTSADDETANNLSNIPGNNFDINKINSVENHNLLPITHSMGSNEPVVNIAVPVEEISNAPQYNFENNYIYQRNNAYPIFDNLGSTHTNETGMNIPNTPQHNPANSITNSANENQNMIPTSSNLGLNNSTSTLSTHSSDAPYNIISDNVFNTFHVNNYTQEKSLPDEKFMILPNPYGLPTNYTDIKVNANQSKEFAESERLPNTINSIAEFGGVDYSQVDSNFSTKHFSYNINNYTSPHSNEETIVLNGINDSTIMDNLTNQTNDKRNTPQSTSNPFNNENNFTNYFVDGSVFSLLPQSSNQNVSSLSSEHLEIVPLKNTTTQSLNDSFYSDDRKESFTTNAQDSILDTPYVPPIHIGTTESMHINLTDNNTFINHTHAIQEKGDKINESNYKPEIDKLNFNITINTNLKPNETLREELLIKDQSNVMSLLDRDDSGIKQLHVDYSYPNIPGDEIFKQIFHSEINENDTYSINNKIQPNMKILNLNETRFPSNISLYPNSIISNEDILETGMNETEHILPALTIAFNNDDYITGPKNLFNESVSTVPDVQKNTIDAGIKLKEALSEFSNVLHDSPVPANITNVIPSIDGPNHSTIVDWNKKIEPNDSFLLPHLQNDRMIMPLFENGDINKQLGPITNPAISETVQKPNESNNNLLVRNNVIPLPTSPSYYSNQQVNPPINYDLSNYQGYGYRLPQQDKGNIPVINNDQKHIYNNPGVVECHVYETSPDASTCHSYYVCRNNQLVRLFCPYNMVYSPSLRTCTTDKDHCSQGREFVCTSPGFHPDPKSCYSYYECQMSLNGYKVNKYFCPWYSSYNPQYKQCVESDSNCHSVFNNQRTFNYTPNNMGSITQNPNRQPQQTMRVAERYEDKIQQTITRPFQNTYAPTIQATQRQAVTSWVPNRFYWFRE